MITFITYHTDRSAEQVVDAIISETRFVHPDFLRDENLLSKIYQSYAEVFSKKSVYIQTMFDSVRRMHPEAHCLVLTNENSHFHIDPTIEIVRSHENSGFIVLDKMRSFTSWLGKQSDKSNTILLDWDMLVQKNMIPIFQGGCDLLFTVTNRKAMPINGGFIGVGGNSFDKAINFFDEAAAYIENHLEEKMWGWWGDQIAYEHLLREYQSGILKKKPINYHHTKICFLDSEAFNFTPQDSKTLYPDKAIIHFKGARKDRMIAYWERYLTLQGIPNVIQNYGFWL